MINSRTFFLFVIVYFTIVSCKEDDKVAPSLQLLKAYVGSKEVSLSSTTADVPIDQSIVLAFSSSVDTNSVGNAISISAGSEDVVFTLSYFDNNKTISLYPVQPFTYNTEYTITITDQLKSSSQQTFPGLTFKFHTSVGTVAITELVIGDVQALNTNRITDIPLENVSFELSFSGPVNPSTITAETIKVMQGSNLIPLSFSNSSDNKKITVTLNQKLNDLLKYNLVVSNQLKGSNGENFSAYSRAFYTMPDPTPDFPIISDDELLTLVQQQTFKYFWDYAEPNSGMARERNGSDNLVTTGGSGFGIMSIIVGIERNFITRQQGVDRMKKIVTFLETADRFHGAWSHWIDGNNGNVIPFGTKDNGGDLVESSFLVQGLLTFRQYLQPSDTVGNNLINRITNLWQGVEWDWYRKSNENVLYWHWSPNYDWQMNFPLYGYFEEQVTYLLAASSPTHGIPKVVYTNGYGKNGSIVKNNSYYGYTLPLEGPAPLFWVQYSYLGMDPHFTDDYANYWEQNVNATLINRAYCIANPKNYVGYSEDCWGLTASDNQNGYSAHSPYNDLGVITPTAALSSFPYTPTESMQALKFFYYTVGDRLWGTYGFYDAFNLTEGWTASSYLAIDQGPIIVMIENYRSGLLWNLFMSAPEVQQGITELDFQY